MIAYGGLLKKVHKQLNLEDVEEGDLVRVNEVLEANSQERIKYIGKKHLGKVANKELTGKQFHNFLSNVIKYERCKTES